MIDQETGDMADHGQPESLKMLSEKEEAALKKRAHECPVPKPRGIIGQVLGFKSAEKEEEEASTKRVEVHEQHFER